MKNILLLLLEKYRVFCTVSSGLTLSISIFYAYRYYSISLSSISTLIIAWFFFLTVIFNVGYVFAPSVSKDSNNYDIISRWGLVICSLLILMCSIIDICFIRI